MTPDEAISLLARQIDAERRSGQLSVNAEEVASLRRLGACQLHAICTSFIESLNGKIPPSTAHLSPALYSRKMFQPSALNLIQISSQGREMQILFQSPAQLFSTDKFPIPYLLEGELRVYNQRMLDRLETRSYGLFFCVNHEGAFWRFFDWRGPRTAPLDSRVLTSLMERLF